MKTHVRYAPLLLIALCGFRAAHAEPVKAPVLSPIVVTLTVEKKTVPADKSAPVIWQPSGTTGAGVQPGDILRYTVTGSNHTTRPLKGFALTQPIPRSTEYVPLSASAPGDVQTMFSVDGGKAYALKPTRKVPHPGGPATEEPVPPSLYTNVRWTFVHDLPSLASVSAHCTVRVR